MQINEFIHRLFDRAKRAGLEQCEVYFARGGEFETEVFKGEITGYKSAEFRQVCFRALVNGKMGYASTQVLDEDAIDMLVDGVRTSLSLLEDGDEHFLYAGGAHPMRDESSAAIRDMTGQAKIDMAKRMERAALSADARVEQVSGCAVFTSEEERRIVNTLGLDVSHRVSLIGGCVSPVARDGDRVNSAPGMFFCTDLAGADVDRAARKAVSDAVAGLNASPVPSGQYRVALRGDVMASILSAFGGVFSAESAQKGLSLLKGREGEVIADPCVTLMDDPLMAGGLASCPFDAEGVPARAKAVIEDGVFRTLLHNLKTAHKQGVQTTGNASKYRYSSPVGVAPTNFYFAPGELTREALFERMGEGLFIISVSGLHSGADSISGDFSVGCRGFAIHGGKLCEPVGQITLAGNFYDLLRRVRAFASDLTFGFPGRGWMGSPTALVDGLSVAGK